MGFNVPKVRRSATKPWKGFPSEDPSKPIVLHTRPLSVDTREVYNDSFRADVASAEPPKAGDKFDERMHNRAANLAKLARCCIVSWENVTETRERTGENGERIEESVAVECTPDNALRLLRWLDTDAGYREEVTAYINWAANPYSFRDPLIDGAELGKE